VCSDAALERARNHVPQVIFCLGQVWIAVLRTQDQWSIHARHGVTTLNVYESANDRSTAMHVHVFPWLAWTNLEQSTNMPHAAKRISVLKPAAHEGIFAASGRCIAVMKDNSYDRNA
jgi:hypothetical protein